MSKLDDIFDEVTSRAYCTGQDDRPISEFEADVDYAKQQIKELFVALVQEAAKNSDDPTVNDYDEDGTPIVYVYKLLQKVSDL